MTNNYINVNQEKLQEMLRKVIEVLGKDALEDPTGCAGCGAIAGVCSSFPNCPGGESCNKET